MWALDDGGEERRREAEDDDSGPAKPYLREGFTRHKVRGYFGEYLAIISASGRRCFEDLETL